MKGPACASVSRNSRSSRPSRRIIAIFACLPMFACVDCGGSGVLCLRLDVACLFLAVLDRDLDLPRPCELADVSLSNPDPQSEQLQLEAEVYEPLERVRRCLRRGRCRLLRDLSRRLAIHDRLLRQQVYFECNARLRL